MSTKSTPAAGMNDPDSYTIIVKFTRSLSDDLDCMTGKYPASMPVYEKICRQFVEEMQAAYDGFDIAGSFEIIVGPLMNIKVDGE